MNKNLCVWLLVVLLCPLACSAAGGKSENTGPGSNTDGAASGSGGAGGASAGDAGVNIGGGGTSAAYSAPGLYLVDAATPGSSSCAGHTLNDVLTRIRAATPALADVTAIYNPTVQNLIDGGFVYPYQRADGGFAIAFKRGAGDCPSGCTDNTYDYFQTDERCAPNQVGHYHAVSGSCLQVDGTPMWGHPAPPPDLSMVCGADNTPRDISGTYSFRAQGQWQPCATAWDKGTSNPLDATVTVTVAQSAGDPATGTVVVTDSGNPLIDGVVLTGTFIRRRVDATLQKSNLPSNCPQESSVSLRYDFENQAPGVLTMSQSGDVNCSGCKGGLTASLILTSGPTDR